MEKKLKQIIVDVATNSIELSVINDLTVLTNDLGFDSVQIVNLIVELEVQFGIEIDDDDLDIEKLTEYHNLLEMIKNKLSGNTLCNLKNI